MSKSPLPTNNICNYIKLTDIVTKEFQNLLDFHELCIQFDL